MADSCGERQRGAERGAAEVKNGAGAELAPAHACAFHALLDEVLGATFYRPAGDWHAVPTEQRVVHPMCVSGEVATLSLEDGLGVGTRRDHLTQQCQQRQRSVSPEQVLGVLGPRGRLLRAALC